MNITATLNLVAGVVSIISFGLALVQTMRYRQAKDDLEQIRRIKNADIWAGIAITLQAYETIDDARQLVEPGAAALAAKLSSARRAIISQYIQQLRQAILDEPVFTEQTVDDWKRTGRLENDWRVAQAMKFVKAPSSAT